jgi:hypothetical protein
MLLTIAVPSQFQMPIKMPTPAESASDTDASSGAPPTARPPSPRVRAALAPPERLPVDLVTAPVAAPVPDSPTTSVGDTGPGQTEPATATTSAGSTTLTCRPSATQAKRRRRNTRSTTTRPPPSTETTDLLINVSDGTRHVVEAPATTPLPATPAPAVVTRVRPMPAATSPLPAVIPTAPVWLAAVQNEGRKTRYEMRALATKMATCAAATQHLAAELGDHTRAPSLGPRDRPAGLFFVSEAPEPAGLSRSAAVAHSLVGVDDDGAQTLTQEPTLA